MDHDAFDRLTRLLGTPGSRRAALGALLGTSVLGAVESGFARKNGKGKSNSKNKQRDTSRKQRNKQRGGAAKGQAPGTEPTPAEETVNAEAADCSSPGPSSNLSGCNFNGDDLDGFDLSSSNMKNTKFNGASLCGADLSSATLTNADFRNANLTKADLHSSGCTGIKTNAATRFCQTIMCNGTVRSDDCPSGADVCCAADDCAQRKCRAATCAGNGCEYTEQPDGEPGTLCPRECCGGECCPDGQKCCDGACIPNATCCEADCGPNQKCCGAGCIVDTICCTDGVSGTCPPNQQCCQDQGANNPNDNDAGTCKQAIGQTCTDPNHPELDCCFPDFCCQNDTDDGPQCKAGSGKPCIGNDDCCNDAGLFCGMVGSNAVCCISQTGHACNPSVTPCCSPFVCDPDEFECVLPD